MSCRVNSGCTYPPRRIDPITGVSVTIRQPNKRKRPKEGVDFQHQTVPDTSTSTVLHPGSLPLPNSSPSLVLNIAFTPHSDRATETSSFPVDSTLFPDIHDNNDFFSLFAAPMQHISDPWTYTASSISTEASNNILLDLGVALSGEHVDQNALNSLSASNDWSIS